jgi:hypothetical protein
VCAACQVSEAKIHNLDQLHDSTTRHRYSAALESDFEYFWRHQVLGAFRFESGDPTQKDRSRVEAPADECLENLIELAEIETTDPVLYGRQIEWFTRLAIEDPWSLTRERAITALTQAGIELDVGLPRGLGGDQAAATPDVVSDAAARLVKSVHEVIDGTAQRADLEAACAALKKLDLDIGGARRALRIAIELVKAGGTNDDDLAPLTTLATDLEKLCIRRALAVAIDDKEPRVRAAALASSARIGGATAIDAVLFDRMQKDAEPDVTIAIVDTIATYGREALARTKNEAARDEWLAALWNLVETRRESEVRVHAMLALGALSDSGIKSLREEDWQAWWYAREAARQSSGQGASR